MRAQKTKALKRDITEWVIAVGGHDGIIPSSKWIRVQEMIKSNSHKPPRKGTSTTGLITHFLECGHCGSRMRISAYNKKNQTHYYYRCRLKETSNSTECTCPNLTGSLADESYYIHQSMYFQSNLQINNRTIE